MFFSRVNFICWLQWHIKDPGHSVKSAGGRLHLETHTPLIQRSWSRMTMLFRHSVRTYQGKWAHTQLVRKYLTTSSQLAEPLWTDPGLKSEIGVQDLISTLKKRREKKKCRQGMNGRKSLQARKKTPPPKFHNGLISVDTKYWETVGHTCRSWSLCHQKASSRRDERECSWFPVTAPG